MAFVAAQVVRVLLFRSGDIELNPGPIGRFSDLDYDLVDNSQVLGEHDIQIVMKEVIKVKTRYKTFGMILGIGISELDAIQRTNVFDLEDALVAVVVTWLRQRYDVEKYGHPTWRRIVEAIDNEAGGNNHALAKRIANNHPVSKELQHQNVAVPVHNEAQYEAPVCITSSYQGVKMTHHDYSGKRSRLVSPGPSCAFGVPVPSSTLSYETPHNICQRLLAACYSDQVVDKEEYSWPPVKSTRFVPFTMIKQKSKQHSTVRQQVDSTLLEDEKMGYAELLQHLQTSCGKLVVIEGRPGSGKTTLIIEISRDWAKGEILQSKLFFLIRLRMLSHGEEKLTLLSMLSLLFEDLSASGLLGSLCSHITTSSGESVAFALNGLDEYSPRSKNDFIQKLITKQCLPKSTIIVTSRPAGSQSYRRNASMVIEVIGFTGKQIPDYVNKYFSDDGQKAQSLISHLEQHRNLMNACYLPLHLTMLAFLYDEDIELPATETQMYNHLTLSILLRTIKKREDGESQALSLTSFGDLCPEDKLLFDKICELAFDATLSNKQFFRSSELKEKRIFKAGSKGNDEDTLGLVVVDRQIGIHGHVEVYSFFHLTFQEYLAAIHFAGLEHSQQLQLLKKHRNNHILHLVWKFVCGTLDYSKNKFIVSLILKSQLCGDIITRIYFAQESQQELCCSDIISEGVLRLPSKRQLTTSDCMALGYVVSKAAIANPSQRVAIDFEKSHYDSYGAAAFLQQVEHVLLSLRIAGNKSVHPFLEGMTSCQIHGLVQIKLVQAKLGLPEIDKFNKGLRSCINLREIVLTNANIDVLGLKALGEGFKHWKNLLVLNLDNSMFGEEGVEVVSKALVNCPSLQTINLSHNKLGDVGAKHLSEHLNHCRNLEKLSLDKDDISDDGLSALLQGLKCHTNLQELHVRKNNITAVGVQALVDCPIFSCLKVINLRENNLSDSGVKILVEGAIRINCINLTILDLLGNSITDEGLLHLNKLIEVAPSLSELDIRANNFTEYEGLQGMRSKGMAKLVIRT